MRGNRGKQRPRRRQNRGLPALSRIRETFYTNAVVVHPSLETKEVGPWPWDC